MEQPSLFSSPIISVSELTRLIRQRLEDDEEFKDRWIQGEVSNLSRPGSGHIYFTLKDSDAALRCVIWKPSAARFRHILEDGKAIEAFGSIGVYEKGGSYQLYIEDMRIAGEGFLYQEFLCLKERLENEDLFDESHKKPIPERPKCIGIVTSPSGAAIQDILNTLANRYPLVDIVIAPSSVQGDEAPPQIIRGLMALEKMGNIDVIILARGGGSLEDLWAFNDEMLVRTIYAMRTPMICGVGHETDFTLADFVADLRAPTPTGAAVLAVPDLSELCEELIAMANRMLSGSTIRVQDLAYRLRTIDHRLKQTSPIRRINNDRQRLDEVASRVITALQNSLGLKRVNLAGCKNRLHNIDPQAVLKRGYALLNQMDGTWIQSARQVKPGEKLLVSMFDGKFNAMPEKPQLKDE